MQSHSMFPLRMGIRKLHLILPIGFADILGEGSIGGSKSVAIAARCVTT